MAERCLTLGCPEVVRFALQDVCSGAILCSESSPEVPAVNEVQQLVIEGADSGFIRITFDPDTWPAEESTSLEYGFTPAQLAASLETMNSVEPGDFIVTSPVADTYIITAFGNQQYGGVDLPPFTITFNTLAPGGATVTITTLVDGSPAIAETSAQNGYAVSCIRNWSVEPITREGEASEFISDCGNIVNSDRQDDQLTGYAISFESSSRMSELEALVTGKEIISSDSISIGTYGIGGSNACENTFPDPRVMVEAFYKVANCVSGADHVRWVLPMAQFKVTEIDREGTLTFYRYSAETGQSLASAIGSGPFGDFPPDVTAFLAAQDPDTHTSGFDFEETISVSGSCGYIDIPCPCVDCEAEDTVVLTTAFSPGGCCIRIEGSCLNLVDQIALIGTLPGATNFFDPDGPQGGDNPASFVAVEWSCDVIEFCDPVSLSEATIETITTFALGAVENGNIDPPDFTTSCPPDLLALADCDCSVVITAEDGGLDDVTTIFMQLNTTPDGGGYDTGILAGDVIHVSDTELRVELACPDFAGLIYDKVQLNTATDPIYVTPGDLDDGTSVPDITIVSDPCEEMLTVNSVDNPSNCVLCLHGTGLLGAAVIEYQSPEVPNFYTFYNPVSSLGGDNGPGVVILSWTDTDICVEYDNYTDLATVTQVILYEDITNDILADFIIDPEVTINCTP